MVLGTHKDIFERTQIGLNISMDKMTPEIEKNDQYRPCDRGASNEGDRHGDNEVTRDLISEMHSEICQRTQVFL